MSRTVQGKPKIKDLNLELISGSCLVAAVPDEHHNLILQSFRWPQRVFLFLNVLGCAVRRAPCANAGGSAPPVAAVLLGGAGAALQRRPGVRVHEPGAAGPPGAARAAIEPSQWSQPGSGEGLEGGCLLWMASRKLGDQRGCYCSC